MPFSELYLTAANDISETEIVICEKKLIIIIIINSET
jgi:hypothetical protein